MENKLQMLAKMLVGKSTSPDGMLGNAVKELGGRAYQLHVQEAQALGQTPMSQQQFASQQR